MSSKSKTKKDYIIYLILVLFFSSLFLLVPISNMYSEKATIVKKTKGDKNTGFVIEQIPENRELVSTKVIDVKYTSVLFHSTIPEETNVYESHIYNNEDGSEIFFDSLIKEGKLNQFWDKTYELLALKYPKFIVESIKNGGGYNAYEIKDNELMIYFINYPIEPVLDELISLRINYNEIKEFVNFSCKLDKSYLNETGYEYNKDKKTVALTFDDGPSGTKTETILTLLADNKAQATFFMVGNRMVKDKETVKKVYESGNEIGSHTYAHDNLTRQTREEREAALTKTDQIYESITGDKIKLLRPPYGAYKKDMLPEFNYSVVLWNIDTEDWRYKDVDRIVETVLNNLSDGSIILMHDTYATTALAVEKLLPILYSEGYQVVSVSKLAELKGAFLENNVAYRKFK